jgi:hypothetical protein
MYFPGHRHHFYKPKSLAMKKLFLLLCAAILTDILFAYPISPRPLRKLIMESELIVWAKVLDVGKEKENKKKENFWEYDYAILQVHELLHGKIKDTALKVYFSSGMICPAPGVFFKNEQVLAFLDKSKKAGSYTVHALSYGVKHGLDATAYAMYKERIKEMQALLEMDDSREKDEQILEWLVKCAEDKATRWEGVYELSPGSDFMSCYDREGPVRKDIYLNRAQRQRLFNAVLFIDTINYSDIPLVDIVTGMNDAVLLDFLKKRLLKTDTTSLWMSQYIMNRIVRLSADKELEKLLENFERFVFSYDEKEKKQAKQILAAFIEKMKKAGLKQELLGSNANDT